MPVACCCLPHVAASWLAWLAWLESRLKCHQRKNKWQQFSINCICAKLSSILASGKWQGGKWQGGMRQVQFSSAQFTLPVVQCPVAATSVAPPRCWSSQTPLTLQLATITFSPTIASFASLTSPLSLSDSLPISLSLFSPLVAQ